MSKVVITDLIRDKIKSERKKRGKNSVDLSMDIKGSNTYISLVENGRIAKIDKDDLKKIFNILLQIDGSELDKYIDNLIKDSIKEDAEIEDLNKEDSNENNENFKVNEYSVDITKNDYQKLLKNIQKGFNIIFNNTKNKEYIFSNILRFNKNMHFDLGFITALIGIPFYILEKATVEEKQDILNEIADIVEKYADKYKIENEDDINSLSEM